MGCETCGVTGHVWQELDSSDPWDRWPDALGRKWCASCAALKTLAAMKAAREKKT